MAFNSRWEDLKQMDSCGSGELGDRATIPHCGLTQRVRPSFSRISPNPLLLFFPFLLLFLVYLLLPPLSFSFSPSSASHPTMNSIRSSLEPFQVRAGMIRMASRAAGWRPPAALYSGCTNQTEAEMFLTPSSSCFKRLVIVSRCFYAPNHLVALK